MWAKTAPASLPTREGFAIRFRQQFRQLFSWPSLLLAATLFYLSISLFLPFFTVVREALFKGLPFFWQSLSQWESLHAFGLTLSLSLLVVPLNTVFGIAFAYAVGKFKFPGRGLLIALIDLPLCLSPVVAGLMFILVFGSQGIFGNFLEARDWKIIFAFPGLWLCSLFVTLPYVARELIPFLEAEGRDLEESALMLGAGSWQCFFYITLPRMKWALFHGIILCNARVMGEFGAVSVVSGHIRGETNTVPLLIEILYNEYQFTAAFALSFVLACLAFFSIILKKRVALRIKKREPIHATFPT